MNQLRQMHRQKNKNNIGSASNKKYCGKKSSGKKKTSRHDAVSEPGMVALIGAGAVAAVAARKMGPRKKKLS